MTPMILVFGGPSAEHEVSVRSARSILQALDRSKFSVTLIGIESNATWRMLPETFLTHSTGHGLRVPSQGPRVVLSVLDGKPHLINLDSGKTHCQPEVAFAIVHGTYGEDGSLQGLFRMNNLAYVGPSVLGSSVGMDKAVTKAVLLQAGIEVSPGEVFLRHEARPNYSEISKSLGQTLFIKPANAGSSVGVSKVSDQKSFDLALEKAFEFDNKLLVESQVIGRELECAVLGNEEAEASTVAEIIPKHDFYSYEAKYLNDDGAQIKLPAELSNFDLKRVQEAALATYRALSLEGLSRVDFFLSADGKLLVNEVNTLPGFTSISMYPKLWELSGLPYSELISKLLNLAIARRQRESAYKLKE